MEKAQDRGILSITFRHTGLKPPDFNLGFKVLCGRLFDKNQVDCGKYGPHNRTPLVIY